MSRVTTANAFRISALLGFTGVALGAFGAHFLLAKLEEHHMTDVWKTGVLYQLVHSVVMLGLSTRPKFRAGAWAAFGVGVVLFSGSLYALALGLAFMPGVTGLKWIGVLTPIGGVFFLGGYLALAWQARDWVAQSDQP